MKILLQQEAQTISEHELEKNQQYLINLLTNIYNLPNYWIPYFRRILTINHHENYKQKDDFIK